MVAEFDGLRAKLYQEALDEFLDTREEDIKYMKKFLAPKNSDKILGIGEGNGFFVKNILDLIGIKGEFVVTDPSVDQLENLEKKYKTKTLKIILNKAENLNLKKNYFDKVWSFGAFHHCLNQERAMKNIFKFLKPKGKLVLCDVFRETPLSEHFDKFVAKYCFCGHDVKFLGETYARTILEKAGFKKENIEILDLPIKWKFKKRNDIGKFIYKLHAMTLIEGKTKEKKYENVLKGCEEILGIKKINDFYELNWPMKIIIARK